VKKVFKAMLLICTVLVVTAVYFLYPPTAKPIQWPAGKKFAFTIVDDTDASSLDRLKPLYEVLDQNGLRTTKTIWVLEGSEQSHFANTGVTLRDPAYREFLHDIQRNGFEIALHGVRGGSSKRDDIFRGLDIFKKEFGEYPGVHINHSLNKDNLYWGGQRYTLTPLQWIYSHLKSVKFYGDNSESEYFWGDIARQRIKYVRRFTFREINLLKINPSFPYRLENKPYVNLWFPGSDGGNIKQFNELLKKENLDRLEREGGATIVYAHLGAGSFNEKDNSPDPRFIARIKDLSSRNGWFAPANEILDHLRQQPGWNAKLSFREKIRLDLLFVSRRIFL
jgi:hypothetical protein